MPLTPDEPRQATLLSLPEAIPPPDPFVTRLTAALCVDRPWQRIVDPDRAAAYFRARAVAMLAGAPDPLALAEREEGLAAQQAVSAEARNRLKAEAIAMDCQ